MDTTGEEQHVPSDKQIEAGPGAVTHESAVAPPLEHRAKNTSSLKPILITLGVLMLGLFAASQVYLITSLNSTQSQIDSLDSQVTDLGGSMYDMSQSVDAIAAARADSNLGANKALSVIMRVSVYSLNSSIRLMKGAYFLR